MTDADVAGTPGKTHHGRDRADFPPGTVVFLIGFRISSWRNVRAWLPVLMAMPPMLRELFRQPELGLLGARSWMGWRVVMVQQYWESMDKLMAYAAASDAEHLPAWRAFNRRSRKGQATGIWHETYTVDPATSHIVYANMPPFGMGEAILTPCRNGQSSPLCRRTRLCFGIGCDTPALYLKSTYTGKARGVTWLAREPMTIFCWERYAW